MEKYGKKGIVCQDRKEFEPILERNEKATGSKVKAIYDVEAAKTVRLVNLSKSIGLTTNFA